MHTEVDVQRAGIRCAHCQPTVASFAGMHTEVGWDDQRESQLCVQRAGIRCAHYQPTVATFAGMHTEVDVQRAGIRCAHCQPTFSLPVGWDDQRESQLSRYERWNSLRSLPAHLCFFVVAESRGLTADRVPA